jgi:hypothetical protein
MLKIDSFFLQRFGDVIPSPWPFLGYSQLLKKEKKKKKKEQVVKLPLARLL